MMACRNESCVESSTEVFEKYCVDRAPTVVYYIPDFVTAEEEGRLWHCIYTAPKPKWTVLSHRRLQNWGGLPHCKGMVPEPLPQWLSQYTNRISALGVFGDSRSANHVLVNEYTPGQGIMAHVDGPLFYPTISTLNVGGHTLLNLYSLVEGTEGEAKSLTDRFLGSLLLEPRSLLILQQNAYTTTLHDIADTDTDLVCRDRVFNWDQTALGRWAASLSADLLTNAAETFSVVSRSRGACGENKRDEDPDKVFSREEGDGRKDSDSKQSSSMDDCKNIKLGVQQGNGENGSLENRLASEGNRSNIRNIEKDDERILSGLPERGVAGFIDYLHNRFQSASCSFGFGDETSNKVESRPLTNADGSTAVNGRDEKSVATGDALQRKDAMYSLEMKLARCENALLNETPLRSEKSSTVLNSCAKISDTLAREHCTESNDTLINPFVTTENDQVNSLHATQFFSTHVVPNEVCKSLTGPGHGSSVPAVQPVSVADKQCFLLSRGTRISLTIRHVPKVIRTKIFLGRK